MKAARCILFMALAAITGGRPAQAQRAAEQVLASAEDAFGTTVGTETIGLYSASSARGFSPVQAGNVRIEGLYYQGNGRGVTLSGRLIGRSSIRVGLSAQSYPFPSPSGIADFNLRLPGNEFAVSTVTRLGPYESTAAEIDVQLPVTESLGFSLGAGVSRPISDQGTSSYTWSAALIGRWRVGDNIEIIPFYSRDQLYESEFGPSIFGTGSVPPPKYPRGAFLGADWADNDSVDSNLGVIARASWQNWRFRFGWFQSLSGITQDSAMIHYNNVRADGIGERVAVLVGKPEFMNRADSGEMRVSRLMTEGPRLHEIILNARGRLSKRSFAGITRISLGRVPYHIPAIFPEPSWVPTRRAAEKVEQGSFGIGYGGRWPEIGELSFGLQKVYYGRTTDVPPSSGVSDDWLYYGSLAAYISDRLVVYTSYSRGLEDSRAAPPAALNSGEGVPASITQQVDLGFRYALTPSLRFVASVFETKKPFYELDSSFIYRSLGAISNRGFEASLTGAPLDGLTVVAGVVLLKQRLSGELVDQGALGEVPTGSMPVTLLMSGQYGPRGWGGFSVDGRVSHTGSYYADSLNTFRGKAITTVDLGARYRFTISTYPASLRFQVANVLDVYEWRISGGVPTYAVTDPRTFLLQLTVDF
jgi:iron complex outermembrane receptor protein